jgi:hypothetical protein
MGVELGRLPGLTDWVERLTVRPSIAAEVELVAVT